MPYTTHGMVPIVGKINNRLKKLLLVFGKQLGQTVYDIFVMLALLGYTIAKPDILTF